MPRCSPTACLSFGIALGGLSACGEPTEVATQHPSGVVDEITIRADVGMVEVLPGRTVRVAQSLNAPDGAVARTEQLVDGHLVIDVRCKSPVFCSVDTRLRVPDGVPVSIELEKGEVWATGVGDLDIELGTGALDLDVTGPLRGRVGQGSARIQTAAGQLVRLAVGQGDIDVAVPRTPWNVDIQSSESQLLGVVQSSNARGALELTAPAGLVRVRALGGPVDSGSPTIP